jgi:hypothetical protein
MRLTETTGMPMVYWVYSSNIALFLFLLINENFWRRGWRPQRSMWAKKCRITLRLSEPTVHRLREIPLAKKQENFLAIVAHDDFTITYIREGFPKRELHSANQRLRTSSLSRFAHRIPKDRL